MVTTSGDDSGQADGAGGIARLCPTGAKRGYRKIEYMLRSTSCVENRHLRRLTGGGTHGGRRALYADTFSNYEPSPHLEAKENRDGREEKKEEDGCLPMEAWAEEFMRMVLYDERGSQIAVKGRNLKKDLVDSVAIVERVEEVLERKASRGETLKGEKKFTDEVCKTGAGVMFFDVCSGKGITGLMLTYRFPEAKIVGMDIRPPNPAELHLEEGAFENMKRHTGDIYDEDLIERIMREETLEDGTCILLGTHLCGDLSRMALDMISRYPAQVSAAIVAPCCLMRQRTTYRPWLNSERNSTWGIDTAQIARRRGIDSFEYWLERLKDRAPVGAEHKAFVRDDDMLSTKNTFIVIHCPPDLQVVGEKESSMGLCQVINDSKG